MLKRSLIGGFLLAALLAVWSKDHEPAPQFRARSLDGESFSNESVNGNVVLLQFWTTWCPYCRREQPMIDRLSKELSNKGVVVLAVDVAESEAEVRDYLERSPRAVPIVLTRDTNLVNLFSPREFPTYVVIDRQGNVAYVQRGAAGERALRSQLRRGGLDSASGTAAGNAGSNSDSDNYIQVVQLPASSAPAKPLPPAVFILASGERLETERYTLTSESLRVTVNGQPRTIPLKALDMKATIAACRQRGIDLKIPKSRSEITLGP